MGLEEQETNIVNNVTIPQFVRDLQNDHEILNHKNDKKNNFLHFTQIKKIIQLLHTTMQQRKHKTYQLEYVELS